MFVKLCVCKNCTEMINKTMSKQHTDFVFITAPFFVLQLQHRLLALIFSPSIDQQSPAYHLKPGNITRWFSMAGDSAKLSCQCKKLSMNNSAFSAPSMWWTSKFPFKTNARAYSTFFCTAPNHCKKAKWTSDAFLHDTKALLESNNRYDAFVTADLLKDKHLWMYCNKGHVL